MSRVICSIEQLEEALDRDIAWRKKELLDLRLLCTGSSEASCLLRATFVLSCAHFEGFLRFASNTYVSYISSLGLSYGQLRLDYSSILVRNRKHELFNSRSGKKVKVRVISELLIYYEQIASQRFRLQLDDDDMPIIDEENISISTEGNPTTDVLREISDLVGLDYSTIFESREQFIDRQLLRPRHMIAHGQKYPVDKGDMFEVSEYVLGIMNTIKTNVLAVAESDAHLRATST